MNTKDTFSIVSEEIGRLEDLDAYEESLSAAPSAPPDAEPRRLTAGRILRGTLGRLICVAGALLAAVCFLSSGKKMNLSAVSHSADDRDTLFGTASANLLASSLSEIHRMPTFFILKQNNDPTPVPAEKNFTKQLDPDRQNYDGSPIDCYEDDTISVKCWKEIHYDVIFNFAEVEIAHPSQFRRKLVDDVVSKNHLDYPLNIFRNMHGVVGMTADYCAYRPFGTIVQYGDVVRDVSSNMDLLIFDKNGNLSSVTENEFYDCDAWKNGDVVYTFAFGPMLIDNYQCSTSGRMDNYVVGEMSGIYPRAAICQFGYDRHYLLCTADYMTRELQGTNTRTFAKVLQQKGVRFAYNLDGGQTAALMYNNRLFNKVAYGGQRLVSDILFFATALPDDDNRGDRNS